MTSLPTGQTSHPVLFETTRTYLVWVKADSAAQARRAAEKDPGAFLAEAEAMPVDSSTDTAALTEDTAAWLDLDPEAYQRLDDYFATVNAASAFTDAAAGAA
jgi:hypothetical protein